MTGRLHTRLASVATVMLIALGSSAAPSIAADPPDVTLDFAAGDACAFELRVEVWNNPNRVSREFKDKNGNVVRMLTAGKGNTLAFTNLSQPDKMLKLKANGSVEHITFNPDKSQKWTVTGHNVLILYPTDVPAGPSTTQYVGRLVFTIDTSGVFTLQSASGTSIDICAALLP